jgi:hypothetical protein
MAAHDSIAAIVDKVLQAIDDFEDECRWTGDTNFTLTTLSDLAARVPQHSACGTAAILPYKKSVRFSSKEHVQCTLARTDMSKDEVKAYWWSEHDFETTRRKARALIKYTADQGSEFVERTLRRAFRDAVDRSSDDPVERFARLSHHDCISEEMSMWMKHCNGRRGLENIILGQTKVTQIIGEHRQVVLRSSRQKHTSDDEVREISCRHSFVSALFARTMGHSDSAYAVNNC